MTKTLLLDCGSGGRASQRLINELFLEQFDNPILRTLDDAAKLELSGPIAMSTDGYTVTPLFFPGGNIGTLAVHGTVNDVSMLGARPRYLTCGFILEEGLDLDLLRKVVESMAEAARSAGVLIVSGDTKVVPRGACDKLFITTAGVGEILADPSPSGSGARPGDAILVSGAVGDHGLAVLGQRDSLSFLQGVESDSAALNKMVERLMLEVGDIHVLRDPTRGGLATTLNEIAGQSGVVCSIEEASIPIHDAVRSGCDVLGLDPLYLANEGKMLCFVPEAKAQAALDVLRSEPQGREAAAHRPPAVRLRAAAIGETLPGDKHREARALQHLVAHAAHVLLEADETAVADDHHIVIALLGELDYLRRRVHARHEQGLGARGHVFAQAFLHLGQHVLAVGYHHVEDILEAGRLRFVKQWDGNHVHQIEVHVGIGRSQGLRQLERAPSALGLVHSHQYLVDLHVALLSRTSASNALVAGELPSLTV